MQNSSIKIVSGGQTGVDRGALDAALANDSECGGWCPAGRLAEDGRIAESYPLVELPDGGYVGRTEQNVVDSDATVIIYHGEIEGGTLMTGEFCEKEGRPLITINAADTSVSEAAQKITAFAEKHGVRVLNVAGPRASKWPGARRYAQDVFDIFLSRETSTLERLRWIKHFHDHCNRLLTVALAAVVCAAGLGLWQAGVPLLDEYKPATGLALMFLAFVFYRIPYAAYRLTRRRHQSDGESMRLMGATWKQYRLRIMNQP